MAEDAGRGSGQFILKFIVVSLALIIVVPLAGIYWAYSVHQQAMNNPETLVYIQPGQGMAQIISTLRAENLVESELLFKMAARVQGVDKSVHAGEYMVPANTSQAAILDILSRGETYKRYITIIEGESVIQAIARLNAEPYLEGSVTIIPEEGRLLPETYQFVRGESRQAVLDRMRAAMDAALEEAWQKRDGGLPVKSKEEMLIMASVVEKETAVPAERGQVAAVFLNRLRRNMKLQADPTVVYCLTRGEGPLGRRLLRKDLQTDCPYNTYTRAGLPAGPIANPSRASLMAVANPDDSRALYFVADGTGGHVFADTLEEHTKNVARWRKIRASQ